MTSLASHRLDPGKHTGAWGRASLPLQSSPTLARVHRATMRLEGILPPANIRQSYTTHNELWSEASSSDSTLKSCPDTSPGAALKRGILVTLRHGALFRRWKERYFLLTKDYFTCFKIISGPTPMGPFIYKIRLAEIRSVTWTNSRSDAMGTITLELGPPLSPSYDEPVTITNNSEGPITPTTIQLRAGSGVKDTVLEDWFEIIEESVEASKSRRAARTASMNKTLTAMRSPRK